jgi:hypothetical protein
MKKIRLHDSISLSSSYPYVTIAAGRDIAQAVSRRLPTAAARVHVWAACRIFGGQIGAGAGFLRVLRFLLPIFIPPISLTTTITYDPGLVP